jgi:AsmA protein
MQKSSLIKKAVILLLKITGFFFVAIVVLFTIATLVIYVKKNEWLLQAIQKHVNESQAGQLIIESTDLKLLRNFPDITIRLNGIDYYEHKDSLRPPGEKPILHAENLFVALEIMPLFDEVLNVVDITLEDAKINIVEYKDGKLNVSNALLKPVRSKPVYKKDSSKTNPSTQPKKKAAPKAVTKPQTPLQVNLEDIRIRDLLLTWHQFGKAKPITVLVHHLETEIINTERLIESEINCSGNLNDFISGDSAYLPEKLACTARVTYNKVTKDLAVTNGKIKLQDHSIDFYGSYNPTGIQKLDAHFNATFSKLNLLALFIRPEVLNQNSDLFKQGEIFLKGTVFGELKNQSPRFDISFGMKELNLKLPGALGGFNNIGFEGKFFSGNAEDYSEASLELKNLRGNIPGGYIKGNVSVTNFKYPYLDYNLRSRLKINGLDQIFKINLIKNLSGSVFLQAQFKGPLRQLKEHKMDNRRSSVIVLNNISFDLTKTNMHVSGLSSKIENRRNRTSIQNLAFNYGKDDLQINATMDNALHYFFFQDTLLNAEGNIHSNQLYTKDIIPDTTAEVQVQDRISNLSFDFKLSIDNEAKKDSLKKKRIQFDIRNLSMNLDKLPNIKRLDTNGWVEADTTGIKMKLNDFHADMPSGKIHVTGDMHIPVEKQMEINAHLKLDRFPWTYIKELSAEISTNKEPTAKNLPVSKMEIVTAELNLSASLTSYPFDIRKLVVPKGTVHYYLPDADSISADISNLSFDKIHFNHPENSGSIIGVKDIKGTMDLKNFKVPELQNSDMTFTIEGENDVVDLSFTRRTAVFEKQKGRILLNLTKKEPSYIIDYSVKDASLKTLMNKMKKENILTGKIDLSVHFNASGSTWKNIRQSFSGEFEISGNDLTLRGIDVDDAFNKYQQSQNFTLTDLGAVVVAGPIGLVVTKGGDFISLANIKLDSTKLTEIKALYTNWKLSNGQITSKDVAFTTKTNRIAFNGTIDFKNDTVPGLSIAIVDKIGCSLLEQTLSGKFGALKSSKVKVAKTLFGSVTNSMNAIVGKDCTPFYTGKVKNP